MKGNNHKLAESIAISNGYERADFVATWKGFEVYLSAMNAKGVVCVGMPVFIFVDSNGKAHVADRDEWGRFVDARHDAMERLMSVS